MSEPASKARINEAMVLQWAWKPGPMSDMIAHVLKRALKGGEFSANDLAVHGADQHGGTGIAGSAILQLKNYGVIAPVGVFADQRFCPRTVKNPGGNNIGVYRLASESLARTLLQRHADIAPEKHEQLGLFETRQGAASES